MTYLLTSQGEGVEGAAVTYSLVCTLHSQLERHVKPFLKAQWETAIFICHEQLAWKQTIYLFPWLKYSSYFSIAKM